MILAHMVFHITFDGAAVRSSDSDVNGGWKGLCFCTQVLVTVICDPAPISRTVHSGPTRSR